MKLFPAFILLILGGCLPPLLGQTVAQSDDRPDTSEPVARQTYGRVEGDIYISPTGLYKVKIPVLPQLGGTVSDTPNLVTFDDDYSIHINIGAFPLSRELKAEYDVRGTKDFLIFFFTNLIMPDYAANFHGAQMEPNAIFLGKFQNGSMLIFLLLPGGSVFEHQVRMSNSLSPAVAKRGNLCFVKNGYVFVVSTELAERVLERSTYKKSPEEENAILRDRLMDIVAKMQFSAPAPETKG
jgi:hypothetical protein